MLNNKNSSPQLDVNRYKVFIFDFDGVIVDSVNVKRDAFAEIYKPFGDGVVSRVVSHHLSHGGMNRFEKFRSYHRDYLDKEISEPEVAELAERFSELTLRKVLEAPFIKGAFEFLTMLKNKDEMTFVVSGTPESEIKEIVRQRNLGEYFVDVKGAPAKKVDNMRYLIKKHGINKGTCVYFGDSKEDLSAATDLDIFFVPINYFNHELGYRNFVELMNP